MRSYLIYKEKARRWNEDKEIQALVSEISNVPTDGLPHGRRLQQGDGRRAQGPRLRPQGLGARGLGYEKLDQLTIEVLLGVR